MCKCGHLLTVSNRPHYYTNFKCCIFAMIKEQMFEIVPTWFLIQLERPCVHLRYLTNLTDQSHCRKACKIVKKETTGCHSQWINRNNVIAATRADHTTSYSTEMSKKLTETLNVFWIIFLHSLGGCYSCIYLFTFAGTPWSSASTTTDKGQKSLLYIQP